MFFSIIVALMVLMIAVFWTFQGFFSSLLMFLQTLTAALLAFGLYPWIQSLWAESMSPSIGEAVAFAGVFCLSLLIMRLLTDKVVPGNVQLNLYVDRGGGAICGFFVGMTLVGTMLVGIQMLPLGSGIFGFERVQQDPKDGRRVIKNFWFKPDAFVVGMAKFFSGGRFGTGDQTSFAANNPDLLLDLYARRDLPQSGLPVEVPENALKVLGYWDARQIDKLTQDLDGNRLKRNFDLSDPDQIGNKFLVCRVRLDARAAHENAIRFRIPQFRIVGPPPGGAGQTPKMYLACGSSDLYINKNHGLYKVEGDQRTRLVRFDSQTNFILEAGITADPVAVFSDPGDGTKRLDGYEFDVAFEVPENFEPWYMEFKDGARYEFRPADAKTAAAQPGKAECVRYTEPPDSASVAKGKEGSGIVQTSPKVGMPPGGEVHYVHAIPDRTGVSALLPMPLDREDPKVRSCAVAGKFNTGSAWVESPTEKIPEGRQITQFYVPDGKRLVQIGGGYAMPKSMFGKALNYAKQVTPQISVIDSNGVKYYAVGAYFEGLVNGKKVFEIFYYPGDEELPEKIIMTHKPQKVTDNAMRATPEKDQKMGFLFLVDPGVKLVKWQASAADSGQTLDMQVD